MGHYSPGSPQEMSPDIVSPVYPDPSIRPIRPLPKRRLRERLSSDVAESIKYPPAPPTTTPLFYYPYGNNGTEDEARGGPYPVDRQRADEIERNYISRRNGDDAESDEEIPEYPARGRFSRHSLETSNPSFRYVQKPEHSKYAKPEPPASTSSSADGYDSFENTNNKKKRKIPTPGDAGLNGIHLSNDLASLGISKAGEEQLFRDDLVNGTGQPHGTSASTGGVSGSGRGRLARRTGRSPLRTLSDAPNHWPNGRGPKQRQSQCSTSEGNGIISSAIANAEKVSVTPAKGQENTSLLDQQAAKKPSPTATQFTFTCDSQVPGIVTWPGPNNSLTDMNQSPLVRQTTTHGTQTTPKASSPSGPQVQGPNLSHYAPTTSNQNSKLPASAPAKPRRRRTARKEYLLAARERREQQEYQNHQHSQAAENKWMCQFCEYELIFGSPPEALIRKYEVKDRRRRKDEAERRRLLEKAKMKGRKSRKSGKMTSKVTAPAPPHDRHSHSQPLQPPPINQSQSQSTQSEEYYDDEYEEDNLEEGELPRSSDAAPSLRLQEEFEAAYDRKRYASTET